MLYSEDTWQRTGHVLSMWFILALQVTLIYSSRSSLCDSYPLYGKVTAKSNILVVLFQDVQMRKPSQTSCWNGKEKEFIKYSFDMHLTYNIVATQMLTVCQPWLKLNMMVDKHCEVSCSKCLRRCRDDQNWQHLRVNRKGQISSSVTKRRTSLSMDFCFSGQN